MPQSYTLIRTGDRPLAFTGEVLATASSGSRSTDRWHELTLYRTESGKFVLTIDYCTKWENNGVPELKHYLAEICATVADVAATLRGYDPCGYLQGFPPGSAFAEKQERKRLDLRLRYETAVSELLGALEPEEV